MHYQLYQDYLDIIIEAGGNQLIYKARRWLIRQMAREALSQENIEQLAEPFIEALKSLPGM